jgi:hypothetical protein
MGDLLSGRLSLSKVRRMKTIRTQDGMDLIFDDGLRRVWRLRKLVTVEAFRNGMFCAVNQYVAV